MVKPQLYIWIQKYQMHLEQNKKKFNTFQLFIKTSWARLMSAVKSNKFNLLVV